ncbi:MAG: sulfatase [Verrucomicrobiota bacterium]
MKPILTLFTALILSAGSVALDKPNVLLICIDDLRPELKSFGADYIKSPHIDQLAQQGRAFLNHYVNSPSCGPSRYTLLTGRCGDASNKAIFMRAEAMAEGKEIPPSMPEWFRQNGYTTVSVGKVSHHPGGRGGPEWDYDSIPEMPGAWDRHLAPSGAWQHPRGAMHGLAHGEIRKKAEEMDLLQAEEGPDEIYPDGLTIDESLSQLERLANDDKPFFLAVGILKPHLPFGAPKKYLDAYEGIELPPIPHPEKPDWHSTWHTSNEFMKYNRWGRDPNTDAAFATEVRRYYAACVTYADALVGRVVAKLEQTGKRDNTIVIIWGDHGWHLGERSIWGKHCLFEEALHSPLIISYPGLEKKGKKSKAIVETLDVFPTLCDLAGLPKPDFLQGVSLLPILDNPEAKGHSAIAYRGTATTIRTDTHRLILRDDGDPELYDFTREGNAAINAAAQDPLTVSRLTQKLQSRLNAVGK